MTCAGKNLYDMLKTVDDAETSRVNGIYEYWKNKLETDLGCIEPFIVTTRKKKFWLFGPPVTKEVPIKISIYDEEENEDTKKKILIILPTTTMSLYINVSTPYDHETAYFALTIPHHGHDCRLRYDYVLQALVTIIYNKKTGKKDKEYYYKKRIY